MEVLDLLDPRKLYFSQLKSQHRKNVEDFFDELTKKSNVNVEANRETIKEYNNYLSLLKKAKSKENRMRFLKIFLIVIDVILFFVDLIMIIDLFNMDYFEIGNIIIPILLFIVSIAVIFIIVKVINKELKRRISYREKLEDSANKLKETAYEQMKPLNELFDYNMQSQLFTKTAPIIKMDKYFDIEKYEYLHEKYNFNPCENTNESVIFVQSGMIEGNPFLLQKVKCQNMIDHVYTGTKTITWTERVTVNGKSQYVTRSQVLTASVTKPMPNYFYETWLIYGNDAAGELNFSRKPSNVSGKSEKEIDRIVKKGEKKLDNLVKETLTDDKPGAYTKLGNVEFDVLFGAQDRDNEIQFRLLFTPLAQKSMIDLIKNVEPYGDDFYFIKKKNLNYIHSIHMDKFNLNIDPSNFEGFDYDYMKDYFINYSEEYFKAFFFNLAPVLAIPLYQQQKPIEYIYKRNYVSNFTTIEHEVLANSFDDKLLRPERSGTDLIIKTKIKKKHNNADNIIITSFSFIPEHRVSYISVLGGDGKVHSVPVEWIDYILTSRENEMEVSKCDLTRKEYKEKCDSSEYKELISKYTNAVVYKKGLLSLLLFSSMDNSDINKLNSILNK